MAIKNVVFDMGGVLLAKAERKDVENALSFKEDTDVVFSKLFHSPARAELDRGVITEKQAFDLIYAEIPERSREDAKTFYDYYMCHRKTNDGMVELLKTLKENGYTLYVLSNFYTDMKAYIKMNGYDFIDDFKEIFNSSEHKLIKPDKEVYEKFLSLYDLDASECFFTDDKEINVRSAIECGFNGATFTDCNSLVASMREMGIKI